MMQWQTYLSSRGSRRIVIWLIVSLSIGMVPLTLWLVKQELIARAGETVALGAAEIAEKLDIVLAERLGDIQAFSRSPLITQKDPAQIVAYLEHLKQLYPMYQRLSVVSPDGLIIASTDYTLFGQSVVSEPWFHKVSQAPQPHAENILHSNRAGGSLQAVRFAVQLHGPQGESLGAVMTEVDQRTLRTFVTQTTQRGNRTPSHPDIEEFQVLSNTGEILLASDLPVEGGEDHEPIHVTAPLLTDHGMTGYVEEVDTGRGIDALTGFARMVGGQAGDRFQWRILVRADRGRVLQSIWTLLWKLLGIGTACLLPLLGLFFWSCHRQLADESQAGTARRALEANEARIRKILEVALDAVITIDHRGLVTGWNTQAEHIFGWKASEVLGQSLTNTIIPPGYREAHERGLRHFAATGEGAVLNKRIEITALDRTGREFPVELAITPMHHGGQTVFSAFLRDITQRKQAEDELRHSQEAAKSANQAKTEFLANMSHELRTPLNAIQGTTDLLLKTPLTPEQHQCALMGQRASQALLRLVNDVLDLAKIEAGTLRVESKPFNLGDLLDRITRLMELRRQQKEVAFRFDVLPDVPLLLEGDAFRLEQILLNLLGNALKFTEQGSVTLTVSRADQEAHRPLLRFAVSDTGIGIPANQLDHIFGRFIQIDSGDNRKYGGTGLGLSISKQLVEMMGGTIQVTSELGKGSTFTVTVPFSISSIKAISPPISGGAEHGNAGTAMAAAPPRDSPLTILLVDDFLETQQLATMYLKQTPYRLDLASDGPTAIARCQTHQYDLVFMDLQMPGMDGYAVTTALRTWEHEQHLSPVPILALSADVLPSAKQECLQVGCTAFLSKPFTQAVFLEAIRQYAKPATPQLDKVSPTISTTLGQGLDGQELDRLRQKFLRNRWQDLDTLSNAVAASDWTTIHTIGHRIKGLAGSYGLEEIGTIGAILEEAATGKQTDRVALQIRELTQALERLDPAHHPAT